MKIRTGFVSNSSTSSFTIFGVYLEEDEIKKHFGLESNKDGGEVDANSEKDDYGDKESLDLYEELDKLEVPFKGPCEYWDGYHLGLSLLECRDDETMGDFKKRVIETVNKKAVEKIPADKFEIYEEAYYS